MRRQVQTSEFDLFLLRFLDRLWRQQRLCLAVGGFLGEPQFP